MITVFCHSVIKTGQKHRISSGQTLYSWISFLILQINIWGHGKPKHYKKVTSLLIIKRWKYRTWGKKHVQNKQVKDNDRRSQGDFQSFSVQVWMGIPGNVAASQFVQWKTWFFLSFFLLFLKKGRFHFRSWSLGVFRCWWLKPRISVCGRQVALSWAEPRERINAGTTIAPTGESAAA